MGNVVKIDSTNFTNEVLESSIPVIVDFWAPWCGPCLKVAPILEELAAENNKIKIVKVNVDENQSLAAQYKIMSIPTLLLVKSGKIVNTLVGSKSKSFLQDQINSII